MLRERDRSRISKESPKISACQPSNILVQTLILTRLNKDRNISRRSYEIRILSYSARSIRRGGVGVEEDEGRGSTKYEVWEGEGSYERGVKRD